MTVARAGDKAAVGATSRNPWVRLSARWGGKTGTTRLPSSCREGLGNFCQVLLSALLFKDSYLQTIKDLCS